MLLLIAAGCFLVAAVLFAFTGAWWAVVVTAIIGVGLGVSARR